MTMPAYMHAHGKNHALSPLGYVASSLGGLAAGIGVALLLWQLI